MIQWRPYQTADEMELRARHAAQCAALGAEFAFPELSGPEFVLAEVAEREGRVLAALMAHRTVELNWLGDYAAICRDAVRRARHLRQRLLGCGAREAHAFVPCRLDSKMAPGLGRLGFERSNGAYYAWFRELV